MTVHAERVNPAVPAFDRLAAEYDSIFTFSAIGMSQREAVWRRLSSVFHAGEHILEVNCGTGLDALFMVRSGMRVTACDASAEMIALARRRMAAATSGANAEFFTLPTEDLHRLPESHCFDGLFSNFAGLNCISELATFASHAARRLKPGAPLLLCLLTRFCLWEVALYTVRGNLRKAFRRWRGVSEARVSDFSFAVYYPTLSELRRTFAPEFRLISTVGVGITVPPTCLERYIAAHPHLLRGMEAVDDAVRAWPGVRLMGDHMLLHLEKVRPC